MPATPRPDPARSPADRQTRRRLPRRGRVTRPRGRPYTAPALAWLLLPAALVGCGGESDRTGAGGASDTAAAPPAAATDSAPASPAADRPASRSDTLQVEGMPQEIELTLFRADDFPLPFSAYVPGDMAAERTEERAVHVFAEFGGQRRENAFLHVYVFPEETGRQEALATAKGYKTGRGLPVSQGLEPVADEVEPPGLEWAMEAYRFRYQVEGRWYAGTLGVGRHGDRYYMIVRHRPVEMGDGFAPRADLIMETWRWADGTGLRPGPAEEPPPIVEESPTPGG